MDRGAAGSGVALRPNNSRAGVEAVGCSIGGNVLSCTVPGSCADAGPGAAADAIAAATASKTKVEWASARILNAPQCLGARGVSAETRRRAHGADTLPRVDRAVQTRTGRRLVEPLFRQAPTTEFPSHHAARSTRH